MIELTFATAFTLYLSITLGLVLGTWLYSHYRTKKRTILTYEKELFVCEFCHHPYLEEHVNQLNKCPQCGLYNRKP